MTVDDLREKVINELVECIESALSVDSDYVDCVRTDLLQTVVGLLKAQEQEISRLKHHINCDAAEKIPSGCVGFGRGFNDDEPCETCKECEKYISYGVE